MSASVEVDHDRLADVASRLDLRVPNQAAIESVVYVLSQHYDVEQRKPPFECVVASATGVGKTYILAGLIEYLAAARAVRNFAVVTPGRTILNKTVANFTLGHTKSLLGSMESRPIVITAENFDTPSMREAMDDDSQVKLYVFSVQSLTKSTTKVARRTHKFQEGLGAAFYEHLSGVEDLVVFADEHHVYYGDAFSKAIRDLRPHALVGLTATPHAKTPKEEIVFRYPLAAAVADKLVKTPVVVGRKDDRQDDLTKIRDGLALLKLKAHWAESYAKENGLPAVSPVMLIIAQKIDEANEFDTILKSSEVDDGYWADKVLTVHSNETEEALEALEHLEDANSPHRVVISVGMLKEGWDVKSVYVIASMRASVSTILTEQTLGRGLRLPWGAYTGNEMLDTLEVIAHERYEDLLKKAGVLNEELLDYRTRILLQQNSSGATVAVTETVPVAPPVLISPEGSVAATAEAPGAVPQVAGGDLVVTSVEERIFTAEREAVADAPICYEPDPNVPTVFVPRLLITNVQSHFTLADIVNLDPFLNLGRQLAIDPEAELRRVKVSARLVTGKDGLQRTELVTTTAADVVESEVLPWPLDESRNALIDAVVASPVVSPRQGVRAQAAPLVDAFIGGLGGEAEKLLSMYRGRAVARLVHLVEVEQRSYASKPKFEEVVEVVPLRKPRTSNRKVSPNRMGKFLKTEAYNSWSKSLYKVDWFDSEPERAVANIAEDAPEVRAWVRLNIGDIPIVWTEDGREYNPDFVVVEWDDTHWLVEVKRDDDMTSEQVQGKRLAAKRWANHVNSSDLVEVKWTYVLLSETDIREAKGSWEALKSLGI